MRESKIRIDRFKFLLLFVLALIFFYELFLGGEDNAQEAELASPSIVHIFIHPDCTHFHNEMTFLEGLKVEYPDLQVQTHNITHAQGLELFVSIAKAKHIPQHELGTPLFIAGNHYLIGYESNATSGETITQWIEELSALQRYRQSLLMS
jgi:hemerythrin